MRIFRLTSALCYHVKQHLAFPEFITSRWHSHGALTPTQDFEMGTYYLNDTAISASAVHHGTVKDSLYRRPDVARQR